MAVVVARALHDRIREGPLVHNIERAELVIAHDTPAFARFDHLRDIPDPASARTSANTEKPEVKGIAVVHKGVIGIDVTRAQQTRRHAHALHGNFIAVDEFAGRTRGGGHIGIPRRIDHILRDHDPASQRRRHDHTAHAPLFIDQRSATHAAHPERGSGHTVIAPPDLGLALHVNRGPEFLHFAVVRRRESHDVAVPVIANHAQRAHAA